jgi:hypothetical protein
MEHLQVEVEEEDGAKVEVDMAYQQFQAVDTAEVVTNFNYIFEFCNNRWLSNSELTIIIILSKGGGGGGGGGKGDLGGSYGAPASGGYSGGGGGGGGFDGGKGI